MLDVVIGLAENAGYTRTCIHTAFICVVTALKLGKALSTVTYKGEGPVELLLPANI